MEQNIFAKAAEEALGVSKVIKGREKITTDEVIRLYPNGITINEFDIIGSGENSHPVFAFAEDPTKYLNGGRVAKDITDAWIAFKGGDIEAACEGLKESGGVRFKLEKVTTKLGKTVIRYNVV